MAEVTIATWTIDDVDVAEVEVAAAVGLRFREVVAEISADWDGAAEIGTAVTAAAESEENIDSRKSSSGAESKV